MVRPIGLCKKIIRLIQKVIMHDACVLRNVIYNNCIQARPGA